MAWTNFQKSNWTRTVGPEHARQYFPAAIISPVVGNLTFAASTTKQITLTSCAFQFSGNGQIEVSLPMAGIPGSLSPGEVAMAQGINIGNAWLQSGGIQANGVHPQIVFQLISSAAATTAAAGFDLIAVQY